MRTARPSLSVRLRRQVALAFLCLIPTWVCAESPAPSPEAPFEAVTPAESATPPGAIPSPTTSASPARVTPAPTPALTPAASPRLVYPNSGSTVTGSGKDGVAAPGSGGLVTTFIVLLIFCGGGLYLWRRDGAFAAPSRGSRKLVISESRALGNRQFLLVVEYENERLLLGVTPGRIDYLCPLSPGDGSTPPRGGKPPEFKLPA